MRETAARFDRFVASRGGDLWVAAWLLTGDAQHAEDLVQTALLKCYGRFSSFDAESAFEAYLRTTMYRTYVSWWRRRSWRSEVPAEVRPDAHGATPAEDADLREDLRRHLTALPRAQRAVLVLRYVEDKTAVETARILGMPENTVASHTRRALAALRAADGIEELRSAP
ncbi:SigE family RNA polymerase sigma factor [Tessaracoccus caeni]|uniref:SigE family RNA polymerase sigma factor n=1 Tax=Tessaracoccus caeni TaxID=3031239 RepID=UPI0023DBA430|nr:SigE family RNA polymerase sigma factor [Tessaracoccus caeni]MDF1487081.1 SigE family RNA polymerase sigma factor [Tessaracoccus caeni]